jgi:hypothetical protein
VAVETVEIDQNAGTERERALLQPLAEAQMRRVRQRDPQATFRFGPGIDPGFWELEAYVAPPLDSDVDFLVELTRPEVDFQIDHGITVATVLLARADDSGRPDGAPRVETGD